MSQCFLEIVRTTYGTSEGEWPTGYNGRCPAGGADSVVDQRRGKSQQAELHK